MKNSLFDSLFLVNLVFSLRIFVSFEKLLCMAIYNSKIGVWNGSQTMWDLFQNPNFNAENLPFIISRTLTCVCMPVYAYACIKFAYTCIKHAYVELEHACAYACMCTHTLEFSWSLFSKNSLFNSQKELYFPKILSSSQFQFDWTLNWPWALEFQHH